MGSGTEAAQGIGKSTEWNTAIVCGDGVRRHAFTLSELAQRVLPSLTARNYRYVDRRHASLVSGPSEKLYRDTMFDNLEYC